MRKKMEEEADNKLCDLALVFLSNPGKVSLPLHQWALRSKEKHIPNACVLSLQDESVCVERESFKASSMEVVNSAAAN